MVSGAHLGPATNLSFSLRIKNKEENTRTEVAYGGSETLLNFGDTRATGCRTPELR
jgi:hypothetical protein